MKPGIATIALRKYDVFHALDLAAEAGFCGVEIWGKPPHTPQELNKDFINEVRDKIREYGMKASLFGSYVNPMSPDFQRKSADALAVAMTLGARIIRVWAGTVEPHEADEETWKSVAKAFHEYGLRAEDMGITLAMEMHQRTLTLTPEGVLRLIEESNAPNLKLNYQVLDFNNPDLERTIEMVGPHTASVHAQNFRPSAAEKGKMEVCLLKEGLVDYDKVLSLLKKQGFNGYVEVEFLKGEFSCCECAMLDSLKKDAEYLRMLTAKYSS